MLGTRVDVAVTSLDAATAERTERAMLAAVERWEPVFSVFDAASDLWALRRSGSTDVAELQAVVGLAREWAARTGGAFCPTMAPLMAAWDRAEARGRRPEEAELADAVADAQRMAVEHLDLNALAKGWIADRALTSVREVGGWGDGVGAWLSVGGDLVHGGAGAVRVGVEDPMRPYDNVPPLATIEVANEAVATSGGGRRWWTIDGVRHSKVVDPRTGEPTHTMLSATVVASSAAVADVLATTALILGPDDAADLVAAEGGEFLFVLADGCVVASSDRFRRG